MRRIFYRALDRPVSIIGLKGGWIRRFLTLVGGAVLLGIAIGVTMGSGMGIGTAILGSFASFFWCLMKQQKISSRRLEKAPLAPRMKVVVRRRETLSKTLLRKEENNQFTQ